MEQESCTGIDLYWLPLGAGGQSVRLNGRVFEAAAARLDRRRALDLYRAALVVRVPEGHFVVEQAPSGCVGGAERGVVSEGPVGSPRLGRFRVSRYELRRWRDGVIPDVAEAVESPRLLTTDKGTARRLLELVPSVPTLTWGRDELRAGEMWSSNSVIAWLIVRSGVPTATICPPRGRSRSGLASRSRRGAARD